ERAAAALRGMAEFVRHDLAMTRLDPGVAFSYTPMAPDCCYNASLLAAEVLVAAAAAGGEAGLSGPARAAADFVVSRQKPDGRWNYSMDLRTGREREQVDFHQGFILDSLMALARAGL